MQGSDGDYAAQVVAQAVRDGAPLDAVYPSHDHIWRTFGESVAIVSNGAQRARRARHARAR